jgi:5-(carboxyamino)imidazole ribonucleotide synthase
VNTQHRSIAPDRVVGAASFPLPPGSTVGVLGGGQLGRMLAMAAARLGFDTAILSPETNPPAARVASRAFTAPYENLHALEAFAGACDVVTYEFENVPATAVAQLQELGVAVAPGGRALAVAQDRVSEKSFVNSEGIATVPFAAVDRIEDLRLALERIGAPALLKTRREGYDGKGQVWIEDPADAEAAFRRIGRKPAILEGRADFVRELSVIAARSRDGRVACYPPTENHHENGILRRSIAPANASPGIEAKARQIAQRLLTGLEYVGVMGVELFELADGRLLVNEIAPRVHNSGHWTLDACEVDQFEQHIRAVTGWPLGPTHLLARAEMTNLIGDEADAWRELANDPAARVWLYGKGEARPGRKMGHVTRLSPL